jgi:hypothetical protein
MSETDPRMKGAMLAEYLRWYSSHYDVERLRRFVREDEACLAAGLAEDRPAFAIVSSEWYSAALFHRLLDVAMETLSPEGRERFVREGTDAVADSMIRGLYSVLFSLVATPERYGRYIQRAWRQLHDTGEREVRILAPGLAESRIRRWPAHHPTLCLLVHETTRAVFTKMGLSGVTVAREQCVDEGAPECVAVLRWEPR